MSDDNVIRFISYISDEQKHKNSNPVVMTNSEAPQMIVGDWSFTCTSCDNRLEFSTTNVVFRTAEVFCCKCGVPHRITNPAFTKR